jgi:hypothetical protein
MDFVSVKRKYWLFRRRDPISAPTPKTKTLLSSMATCCKRKCSVCIWLLFLGFFVCTNIFHMLDMKHISVSINSMIYIEFMESDSSNLDNETFVGSNKSSTTLHASPFSRNTLSKEDASKNISQKQVTESQALTEALAPFVLRCDVLNVAVTSVPSLRESDFSSESADGDTRRTTNRWSFFRRKRRNNIQIQFSASTALPPKKHFLVRSAVLPRHGSAKTATVSSVPTKNPFNFLRLSFNKTFTGSAERFSRNISTRTVQFNPVEMKRCLMSSISNDYHCFWDGVETNAFFVDDAAQENVSDTMSNVGPSIRHEFTGVTLWNVLHRMQSCDMADYVMNSIIEDSITVNGEKASFISFRGPSFDNSSVLLDAGYYRSYEHTASPFCKYTSTMLLHTLEQFLNRQRQYRTDTWLSLKTSLTDFDDRSPVLFNSGNESILERGRRLDDPSLDREDFSMNDTESISGASFRPFTSNATSHRWLIAYIIVQYQPVESSYDPILVPVSTPRFSLHVNESSWRYNRHLHPPKTNILGFDHIYQNICATAISMPLDGSTNDAASIFHTALAMQDCFDSTIWNQYKGSIVSCRYSILNDMDNDNSTHNSHDDSVHCRHTLERTIQDIFVQNRSLLSNSI